MKFDAPAFARVVYTHTRVKRRARVCARKPSPASPYGRIIFLFSFNPWQSWHFASFRPRFDYTNGVMLSCTCTVATIWKLYGQRCWLVLYVQGAAGPTIESERGWLLPWKYIEDKSFPRRSSVFEEIEFQNHIRNDKHWRCRYSDEPGW